MDLFFSVTSGLKSIIGSDLILDDFIAVFELVKNSFDAHASKVKLVFGDDKIVIWDNGKGMTFDDIQNKWLQVAYSAKKEGEEDNELRADEYKDYRNQIIPAKYFAGAKGIGRFSSDRLGERVLLTTRKASTKATYEQISVNWGDFELDPKEKFEKIKIKKIDKPNIVAYPKFTHGTILEISKLRSPWSRKKMLELKHSLEKLINPFDIIDKERKTTVSRSKKFTIEIEAPGELAKDKKEEEARDQINGPVNNFVFETLGLKTTQIFTEISSDGKFITTQLEDRGQLIYRIRERNTQFRSLADIRMHVFYLNFAAKHNFKRKMGIDSVQFGSVFLYKNGFRIYPFGEDGIDSFGLDRRKLQGFGRNLGTREIVGRIEIFGNDDKFQETSSRDGGLKRTPAYLEFEECFMKKCLQRLERYVVDTTGIVKDENEDLSGIQNNLEAKAKIVEIINRLVDTDKAVLEDYAKDFLARIDEKIQEQEQAPASFEALEKFGNKVQDPGFVKEVRKARREYELLRKKKEKSDQRARQEEEARQAAQQELALEKQKNTYLLATRKTLSEDAEGLIHNIVITTKTINANIDTLIEKIRQGTIKTDEILKRLSTIKYNVDKTQKISRLITRANFATQAEKQITDIADYIQQYCRYYNDIYEKDQLAIKVADHKATLTRKVNILELSMIFDNLISNSEKAGAKKVLVDLKNDKEGQLIIRFSDDGKGVDEKLHKNIDKIFELGITTTDGSGIGLNHVKEGLSKINGDIKFVGNKEVLRGATFEIVIK